MFPAWRGMTTSYFTKEPFTKEPPYARYNALQSPHCYPLNLEHRDKGMLSSETGTFHPSFSAKKSSAIFYKENRRT